MERYGITGLDEDAARQVRVRILLQDGWTKHNERITTVTNQAMAMRNESLIRDLSQAIKRLGQRARGGRYEARGGTFRSCTTLTGRSDRPIQIVSYLDIARAARQDLPWSGPSRYLLTLALILNGTGKSCHQAAVRELAHGIDQIQLLSMPWVSRLILSLVPWVTEFAHGDSTVRAGARHSSFQ